VEAAAVPSAPAGSELQRATPRRNAAVLTVATVAARVMMFALGVVLARSLGNEAYGRYSFAVALGSVLVPVADLGLTVYLTREIARDRAATEAALPLLLRAKAALLVIVAAATVGITALVSGQGGPVLIVGCVVLGALLDGSSALLYGYFRGREAMSYEASATTAAALVRGVGGIALALALQRLWPVVVWIVAVAIVQLALAAWRLRRVWAPRGGAAAAAARVDWVSVGAMGLYSLFVVVYLRSDSVLIGWFSDERAVGLYAAAYTLMLGAQVAPWMLSTALTPVYARTHGRDPREFRAAWQSGIRLAVLIGLPIALVGVALAVPIMTRLYGPGFARGASVLAVVIWVCPIGAISLILQSVLRGMRRDRHLTGVSAICAAFNVGVNLWAIPTYGIMGAAVTTVATEAINVVLLIVLMVRQRLVPAPTVPVFRTLGAGVALVLVARALAGVPVELAVVAAIAIYGVVLVATGVVRAADLRLLARRGRGRRPASSADPAAPEPSPPTS
jgi:O-antigen/teichoic acid export membrane protein